MKIIALVGENPNDTHAIQNLLSQRYSKEIRFYPILRNKRGTQLDNARTMNALKIELELQKYDHVIFIRDLDGLESEKRKLNSRLEWFKQLNKVCGMKGIFLLNIYELEALILADLEVFNKMYKVAIADVGNVMFKEEPKEFLEEKTYKSRKKYDERDCPEIFKKLRFSQVTANCKYFKTFIGEIDKLLKKQ